MNRFRTKKRAKDDLSAGRSSEDSEQSSLSFFRKGKKAPQEEVKKEFDLTSALPSNDDFRTSLLMNNLSARFSMLREQDDPHTKIGKASDDSVLYPKRQSRMADFGYGAGGLADIAEVESIRGGTFLRTASVASDDPDPTNGDSVLTRGRPTEGNNLFGGRQKIYKITAGSGAGMGGRALYEDDVAVSSFQRWRQTERERALAAQSLAGTDEPDDEIGHARSGSPPPIGYNRKRETNSTTSSASLKARNSTAATSITSQGPIAAKDGQSSAGAAASAVTSPIPERNFTRTRRLYEQGFNQDSNEQPGSVASRIENLTRPRPFGSRTPDPSTAPPDAPADRFPNSSRSLLAKTSAPSLRSLSPPAVGRTFGALDLGIRVQTDNKPSTAVGLPPLSPPVSETGEQPILPILPKELGKATAMDLFQKPSQPYDESQYVQRQLQLQQGRDTPTQRLRTESNGSNTTHDLGTKPAVAAARPTVQDTRLPPTPAAETEAPQPPAVSVPGLSLPLEVNIERPSDKDHPAFRQSALPTPLSFWSKFDQEPLPSAQPEPSGLNSQQSSPEDSPTLGPASGLSGLVRQHLRTESVDSEVSGAGIDVSGLGSSFLLGGNTAPAVGESNSRLTTWPSSDQEWVPSSARNDPEPTSATEEEEVPSKRNTSDSQTADRTSTATEEEETDEFANQLANARRRVREKLTSYVESDSSRAPSPLLVPSEAPSVQGTSSNPLGILKPKSSRGSLVDRSRNMITGQSKGLKILGLGAGTTSTPPQSGKPSLEEKEFPALETMTEEDVAPTSQPMSDAEFFGESAPKDEDSNAHPGLKAFRQARRELQRRKELETLARHQASQTTQAPDEGPEQRNGMYSSARADRGPRQRTPSRERRPPPVAYRQRPPSDEQSYGSPVGTNPSGERSRSGSEASGGRSNSRPPRLRTNTNTGPNDQLGPPNPGRPMMRSPGLPGTDIKGSPMMPPYPYPARGAPSPAPSPHLHQSRSAANLALHTGRPGLDPHSGQPSPISPMGLPSPAPYSMGPAASPVGTPTGFGPRPRLGSASHSPALGPASGPMPGHMKRPVDKRDISDPTFVMSTSRVPTTALPHHYAQQQQQQQQHQQYPPPMGDGARSYGAPRSRSNSRAAGPAPPVPPINPRRRRDDARAPYEDGGEMMGSRHPYANHNASNLDYGGASEDERGDHRRRLRKAHPDMQAPGPRPFPGGARDNSPPFVAKGPPASRTVATSNMGMHGGMI